MLMRKERPAFRTIEGWARSVLLETGAIHECEEHGWAKDHADPHARERAILVARQDPPPGIPPDEAVAVVEDVLGRRCAWLYRRHLPRVPAGLSAVADNQVFRRGLPPLKLCSFGWILDRGSFSMTIRGGRMATQIVMDRTGDSRHHFDLTLQLPFCFEMRTPRGGLVSSAPE